MKIEKVVERFIIWVMVYIYERDIRFDIWIVLYCKEVLYDIFINNWCNKKIIYYGLGIRNFKIEENYIW